MYSSAQFYLIHVYDYSFGLMSCILALEVNYFIIYMGR